MNKKGFIVSLLKCPIVLSGKRVDFDIVIETEIKCHRLEETGKPEKEGVATHYIKTKKQKSRGAELTSGISYRTFECYLNICGL